MNLKCLFWHTYTSEVVQTHKYISDSFSGSKFKRLKKVCDKCSKVKYVPLIIGMSNNYLLEDSDWI